MALELWQVEVRARATPDQLLGVVEEIESEVEQAGRDRLPVDENVGLREVPAPRSHHQGRGLVIQRVVAALGSRESQAAPHRVLEVQLAFDHVRPRRAEGVLEVGHEHAGSRIERVDHHLPLDRTGDLHPPIEQVGGGSDDDPGRPPDACCLLEETRLYAPVELDLAVDPPAEQRLAMEVEPAVDAGHEVKSFGRQDSLRAGQGRTNNRHARWWGERVFGCLLQIGRQARGPVLIFHHQPPASRIMRCSTRAVTARR